jgi:hypothetical protein
VLEVGIVLQVPTASALPQTWTLKWVYKGLGSATLGVEVEKNFMQQLHMAALRKILEPNWDQIIDNIQVEPFEHVEFVELVVPIAKPTQLVVLATKLSQPIQPIVEPI